jgi:site-specific DNA-cytosine methylase
MNVLSLFDGISCGQLALKRAGIKVDNYYASEVDRYAIKITQKNFPKTVQLGDVTSIDFTKLPQIDLLLGGSPCQSFSFAGKQLNFDDPSGKLFFEYVRALKQAKPKYFLFENVKMKKQYMDVITEMLGVEPVMIDSALVSGQTRKRNYWTNIPNITQPKDRGISFNKHYPRFKITPNQYKLMPRVFFKYGGADEFFKKNYREKAFNYSSSGRGNGIVEGRFQISDKALTLTAKGYGSRSCTGIFVTKDIWRKLTVHEWEWLQTLPPMYTACDGVSENQRFKAIGSGWTVDVISHILKYIP